MRIVLSIVIIVAIASERSVAAQRLVCGTTRPPHEIEAHEVFRDAFLRVALMHFPELQLQPPRRRGPSATGHPPQAGEAMVWRDDQRSVSISYWRLASVEEATARLCWHREILPVGTRLVEGFADEAYQSPYNTRDRGNLFYRRGPFFFTVSVRLTNPAIDIPRLFLAATDEVLAAELK